MIGVSTDREGQDDDSRSELPNECHDLFSRRLGVFQMRIAHSGIETQAHPQRLRRPFSFRGPGRGIAAGSHFALGEVEDPDAMTRLRGLRECAAARELDVISVSGNGE